MHISLKKKLPGIIRLFNAHHVNRAYVFGSASSNHFSDKSDVDLLVRLEEGMVPEDYSDNYFNLLFALQDLLKRQVDLVTESSLTNPYFINSINRTKVPIYETGKHK